LTELTGPRVVLSPLRDADSATLYEWINDRNLVSLSAAFRPVSQPEHDAWFERIRNRDDVEIFGIRRRGDDRLIGSCQLNEIDGHHRTCELQIRIGDASDRGQGYGTEAVELLLRHAFDDLGLERVGLHVFDGNAAAIRAYERAGFRREGLLRSAALIGDGRVDLVLMGVLRADFAGHGG
jgi:RimJ/RimL family protein N-acetyltransferase